MLSKLLCGLQLSVKPALSRHLHSSIPRTALPPLLFTLAKPLSRIVAAVVGRGLRVWWKRLPADKKIIFKDAAKIHKKKFVVAGSTLVGGLAYAYESHIQECGVTGRRRFVALTPDQTKKISRVEFDQLLEELGPDIVPHKHPISERVVTVPNRILQGNRDIRQIYDKNWTVTVVDQPVKNAFVLPSGNIFVFKGMLDLCENDDQLGIILGHEMAHTVLGHVAEKLTMASFVQVVLLVPMAVLWAILPNDGVALVADWFIDKVIRLIVDLPFSRDMEMEADEVGLTMAAKACFDVREAPALWGLMELMSEDPIETDRDLEFVSTHPCHGTRYYQI
jgi:Zn-dependent protease with chaperone function